MALDLAAQLEEQARGGTLDACQALLLDQGRQSCVTPSPPNNDRTGRAGRAGQPPEDLASKELTAADGNLLPSLPRMAWAFWLDDEHRAAKMHAHFEVPRGIPVHVSVTHGSGSKPSSCGSTLQAGRLYVEDRGYADFQLFQEVIDAGSSFIGRIRENAVWELIEGRPVSAEAKAAGVQRLGGVAGLRAEARPGRTLLAQGQGLPARRRASHEQTDRNSLAFVHLASLMILPL